MRRGGGLWLLAGAAIVGLALDAHSRAHSERIRASLIEADRAHRELIARQLQAQVAEQESRRLARERGRRELLERVHDHTADPRWQRTVRALLADSEGGD